MTRILQILIYIITASSLFGQKIKCSEFPEYNWVLYSSSSVDPFITADTVIIMLDPNDNEEENAQESNDLEKYEWDIVFDLDGTITLINIDFLKAARTSNGPFYKLKYESIMNWSCDEKILKINYEGKIIPYKIGKLKNQMVILIKYP